MARTLYWPIIPRRGGDWWYVWYNLQWLSQQPLVVSAATTPLSASFTADVSDALMTFASGNGPPDSTVGDDGAIYLDRTDLGLWGPKFNGSWPDQPFARVTAV